MGQDYHPFPTSNTIWNNNLYLEIGPTMDRVSITRFGSYGDTIINQKLYNKLFLIENDSTLNINRMTYYAAIRENNNKQIFVKLIGKDFETLIYDFGLTIGDTIISNATTGYLGTNTSVITNIDSIKIKDNTFRKRFEISGGFYEYWIEGIGSVGGLLRPITDIPSRNQYWPILVCLKQNNNVKYLWDNAITCFCQMATSTENYKKPNRDFRIYPNPSSNTIFIETDIPLGMSIIKIINSNGELVWTNSFDSFPIELDLNDKPSGLYLIQVIYGDITYTEKIIKN